MTKVCLNCRRADVHFPYGRPRKNGVRMPMSYCSGCLALPSRAAGGIEAHRRTNRESMRRARRRPTLGPASCHSCREELWWDGKAWRDIDGVRHLCVQAKAA